MDARVYEQFRMTVTIAIAIAVTVSIASGRGSFEREQATGTQRLSRRNRDERGQPQELLDLVGRAHRIVEPFEHEREADAEAEPERESQGDAQQAMRADGRARDNGVIYDVYVVG